MSSSSGCSSTFKPYLKPAQPPGNTETLNPAVSTETSSALMNFLTCATASSVRLMSTVISGRCAVVIALDPSSTV